MPPRQRSPGTKDFVVATTRLPHELHLAANTLADALGVSLSSLIREALYGYVTTVDLDRLQEELDANHTEKLARLTELGAVIGKDFTP